VHILKFLGALVVGLVASVALVAVSLFHLFASVDKNDLYE